MGIGADLLRDLRGILTGWLDTYRSFSNVGYRLVSFSHTNQYPTLYMFIFCYQWSNVHLAARNDFCLALRFTVNRHLRIIAGCLEKHPGN